MLTITGVGLVPYGIHHLGNGYAMHIQKNKDTHVLLTNRLGHTFKVMKRKVTSQSQKRFQKDFDHIMRLTQDKILNRAVLTYLKGGSFIDRKWTFDSVEKKPIIEDDPIREEAITIVNNVGYSKKRDIVVHTINSLISLNETIKGSKDIKDVMLYLIVSSNDTMMRWDFTMSNSGYTSSRTVVVYSTVGDYVTVRNTSTIQTEHMESDNVLYFVAGILKYIIDNQCTFVSVACTINDSVSSINNVSFIQSQDDDIHFLVKKEKHIKEIDRVHTFISKLYKTTAK